jgi:hypothetical protein
MQKLSPVIGKACDSSLKIYCTFTVKNDILV